MQQHLRKIGRYLLSATVLMYLSLTVLKGWLYQLEEDNRARDDRIAMRHHVKMTSNRESVDMTLKGNLTHSDDWMYMRGNKNMKVSPGNLNNHSSNKSHSISGGHRKLFIKDMESVAGNKPQENTSDLASPGTLFPDIIVNQPYLCSETEDLPTGTYLLILVHSHPAHKERRHAIRETWGRITRNYDNTQHVSLLFVLAVSIREQDNAKAQSEAKLYRDVIIGNFTDTYQSLSSKSMFSLHWARTHCSKAKFILKADDDVYLNVSRLLRLLPQSYEARPLLMGYRYNQAPVMRDGQWKVDFNQFAEDSFPAYCSGVAYVMSSRVLQKLLTSFSQFSQGKSVLQIEDVFTTGVLANASGISCTHNEHFPSWITAPSISNLKKLLHREILGIHGVTYTSIYNIQRMIEECSQCYFSHAALKKWFMKLGRVPLSQQ